MKLWTVRLLFILVMISARNSMCMNNARPDQKQLNKQLFDLVEKACDDKDKQLESYKQDIVNMLAQGASIRAINEYGKSLLFLPIWMQEYGLMEFLLERGVDVNASEAKLTDYVIGVDSVDMMVPLYYAAVCLTHADTMLRFLMNHGADVQVAFRLACKHDATMPHVKQRIKNVFIQKVVEEKREQKLKELMIQVRITKFAKLDELEKQAKRSLPEEIEHIIVAEAIK